MDNLSYGPKVHKNVGHILIKLLEHVIKWNTNKWKSFLKTNAVFFSL